MLKSLFPDLAWSRIDAVGFDLDGTLYDERDFIAQVYQPVSRVIADALMLPQPDAIYRWMLDRWAAKGSSYPFIFSETHERFASETTRSGQAGKPTKDAIISQCLQVFREFVPTISLHDDIEALLIDAHRRFRLFLVTDGQSQLQRAKFLSLGLGRWFADDAISISGDHGAGFQKPSVRILENINYFQMPRQRDRVVFFGDRDVDRQFAGNCGFLFRQVHVMQEVIA